MHPKATTRGTPLSSGITPVAHWEAPFLPPLPCLDAHSTPRPPPQGPQGDCPSPSPCQAGTTAHPRENSSRATVASLQRITTGDSSPQSAHLPAENPPHLRPSLPNTRSRRKTPGSPRPQPGQKQGPSDKTGLPDSAPPGRLHFLQGQSRLHFLLRLLIASQCLLQPCPRQK